MTLQRWSWARLLSPSHSALLKRQLQKNSPATSELSWAVPLRRFACLAFLKPGESHTVVTDRQDVCEVQVQIWRGTVVCKVASAGDVCNICQEEVKEKTSLEMSEEYAGVLGNHCVLGVFKHLAKTQRRFDRKQNSATYSQYSP